MAPVVGLQGGQALDAGGDVGQEGGHGHVVQALQLPDEDSGDTVECGEQQHQRSHGYHEPWENTADDAEAEEDQDDVLNEHLRLERQTSVNCRGKTWINKRSWNESSSDQQRATEGGSLSSAPLPSSMSLEKRLRIHAVGVVSKNFIGQRRILWNSRS